MDRTAYANSSSFCPISANFVQGQLSLTEDASSKAELLLKLELNFIRLFVMLAADYY